MTVEQATDAAPEGARTAPPLGHYLDCPRRQVEAALARLVAAAESGGSGRDLGDGGDTAAPRPRLGEALLAAGAITPEQLQRAVLAQRVDRLKRCGLFGGLTDAELARVAPLVHEVSLAPGEALVRQGDRGDCFYVVAAGRVQVYIQTPAGPGDGAAAGAEAAGVEESPLATIASGETIGEMGYFSDRVRSASARATERTELLRFAYDDLPRCFHLNPNLALAFLEMLTRQLRETNLQFQTNFTQGRAAEVSLRQLADYLGQTEHLTLGAGGEGGGAGGGFEGLIDKVVRNASRLMKADRASLFLVDPATGELWSKVAEGVGTKEIRLPAGAGIVGWVAQNGRLLNIPDAYEDPRFSREVDLRTGYRTRTVLCGPVRDLAGKTIGVIQVINKKAEGAFDERDELLFKAFAHQAAIAIENLNLYQRVVESNRTMALMLDVAESLGQTLDLGSLIRSIVGKICQILGCGQGSLFLLDREAGELWSMVAHGSGGLKEIRFSAKVGLAGHTALTGQVLNIADAYQDPRFNPAFDKTSGIRTTSVLCVPLFDRGGKVVGVAQAINKKSGPFGEADVGVLRGISSQMAVALENAQLYARTVSMKNYLESVQESISSGILTLDAAYRVVTANKAALELLGEGPQAGGGGAPGLDAVTGHDLRELLGPKNTLLAGLLDKVYAGRASEVAYDVELLWPGRRSCTVNASVLPLHDPEHRGGDGGGNYGLVVVLEDITTEKRVKSTLTRYMAKDVVDKMLSDPERQGLGGVSGKATIVFSDIREFTAITESLGAQGTVDFLNEYFTLMVDEVMQQGGILDKFIGDALMAVFGVPYPRPDDTVRGVKAALRMKAQLAGLNASRARRDEPAVVAGIGINCAEVISGNIGSQKRMDFTVIGDGVNVASRLEGLNKYYGTHILVSESVLRELGGGFFVRPIDRVVAKGKTESVGLFEVLGDGGYQPTPAQDAFSKGLEAYRRREFAAAREAFLDGVAGGDGPSAVFAERCEHFLAEPPPHDWDGVWHATDK